MDRNTKCHTNSGYPCLDLYFDLTKKRLICSRFFEKSLSEANKKFGENFPKGAFVRQICILILLAKYRGPSLDDSDEPLWFHEKVQRLSWLNSLGGAFGKETNLTTFDDCFGTLGFVSAKRAVAGKRKKPAEEETRLANATYFPDKLRLENVRIFITDASNTTASAPKASEDDLRELAVNLEAGRVSGELPWEAMVGSMFDDIDEDKKLRPPNSGKKKIKKLTSSKLLTFDSYEEWLGEICSSVKREPFGNVVMMGSDLEGRDYEEIMDAIADNVVKHNSFATIANSPDIYPGRRSDRLYLYLNSRCQKIHNQDIPKRLKIDHIYHRLLFTVIFFVKGNYDANSLPKVSAPPGTWLAFRGPLLYSLAGEVTPPDCIFFKRSNRLSNLYYQWTFDLLEKLDDPKFTASNWIGRPEEMRPDTPETNYPD